MIILIKYSSFIDFEEIFNSEKNNHPKLRISVSPVNECFGLENKSLFAKIHPQTT